MNKHLRALSVVVGLVIIGVGVALFIKNKQQDEAAVAQEQQVVTLNKPLPGFEAKTIQGQAIQLTQLHGKTVIVNFWASWCGPCIEEIPSLIKLVKEFPKDVELVAISGDSSMADIDSFLKSFPELKTLPNVHIVFDEDKGLSQKYQIYRLPESFVLDRQQVLVKRISGTIDWHSEDAVAYIKKLNATP